MMILSDKTGYVKHKNDFRKKNELIEKSHQEQTSDNKFNFSLNDQQQCLLISKAC